MTLPMLTWLTACFLFGGGDEHADHGEEGHEDEGGEEEGHEDEGHEEHGDEVVLDPTALANARVTIEALAQVPLGGRVTVPARISLDPRREARVSAVTAGTLERILVSPGDHVKAGESLASVLSPDLGEAIGAHLAGFAKLETARARRDRVATLHTDGFSSKSQLLDAEADLTVAAAEAEAAEERLKVMGVRPETVRPREGEHFASRFSVRSPIAGEILGIDATLGKSVSGGEPLFHVGNLDEVWLIVDVYETSLAAVQKGADVTFGVAAYGGETFTGKVDQIGGWLDPDSRTAEVRVVVPNPDHRLKPNMFAEARLSLGSADAGTGLVIPAEAVQQIEGRPSVFVEEEPGRFEVIAIQTELLPDGRLHVTGGLEEGERVVVEGAFTLKSELAKGELGHGHAH